MSIEVVFFDIDGTLIDDQKQAPNKTFQAIETLKQNGIKVIIATGRSPQHIVDIQKMFAIDSYICFNGSVGYDRGVSVFQHRLNQEHLEALTEEANKHAHPMVFLKEDGCFANVEEEARIDATFHHIKEKKPAFHPTIWREEPIIQGFLYCSVEEQRRYERNHPHLKFTRWHRYATDVNSRHMNKAVGVKAMLEHLQIDPNRAAAFGDNLNDVEMLSFVGHGVAMGNAVKEAKESARYVTKPLQENGIYEGVKQLGLLG